jgi:AAHS family 4-hydroxybenzoate transporter-like MFS transporter
MANSIDVAKLIDERPIGRLQIWAVLLCAVIVFAEGFDVQAIAYVAPSISTAWALKKGALGPVFSASLLGMMLGSLFIAPLADRFGRRPIIILSTLAFGVLSLATSFAWDLNSLLVLRLLTGFGLGGAMPNAIALTSEYSPERRRAFLVMLMFNGFSLGSAGGGIFAAYLAPHYGWHAVFLLGGFLPLLLAPILIWSLPESLQFLVNRGDNGPKVRALATRLDPAIHPDTQLVTGQKASARGSGRDLFTNGRAPITVLLWLVFFMSMLDLYLVVNWLPTVLHAQGAGVGQAAIAGSIFQLGGIVGTIILGFLSDKFGRGRMLTLAYCFAAVCLAGIAYAQSGSQNLMIAIAGAGFGVVGGQIGANALSAAFYPTSFRSTGVGWCLGVGRIGSVIGPVVGGMLLSMDMSPRRLFLLCIIPMAIAAAAAAVIQLRYRPTGRHALSH